MIATNASQAELEALIAGPGPAWIYKHSATCGVSAVARGEIERYFQDHADEPAALIVVQDERPLSNWLATRLGHVHQSPQLFLVDRGRVAWQASHWSITAAAMERERARVGR